MKHINKDYSTATVQAYEADLRTNSLDEVSLQNPKVHPGKTGRQLWSLVRDLKIIPHYWDMKKQLMTEQGGICCYCGLKISFDNDRKATVEHLSPKCNRVLVGEYRNLLLCCSLTQDEENDIKTGVAIDTDVMHCDDTKKNSTLHYTPLQSNCDTRFSYDLVGHVHETDTNSKDDIEVLNLDCQALVDRRKNAMNILYDEQGNILPDADLRRISASILNPQIDGSLREFCFVIKNVIDHILP